MKKKYQLIGRMNQMTGDWDTVTNQMYARQRDVYNTVEGLWEHWDRSSVMLVRDDGGRHYICLRDREPCKVENEAVGRVWAELL